jgi:predicted RNA-binding protein YlqC (UPF0109 family)
MAIVDRTERTRTDTEGTDFYLPASSISTAIDRVEAVVGRVIGRHGRVLIPESYNK